MGFDADGSKELLSQGILYRYFLFKEEKGWTSANQEYVTHYNRKKGREIERGG